MSAAGTPPSSSDAGRSRPGPAPGPWPPRYLLVALVLAALAGLLWASDAAQAVGEQVTMEPGWEDTVQGRPVLINVTAGADSLSGALNSAETVRVSCRLCERTYDAVVEFGGFGCGRNDFCVIEFPGDFRATPGDGQVFSRMPRAESFGEPAHLDTYLVRVVTAQGSGPQTTFQSWLSTANSCRSGAATRSDVMLLSTSGHAKGDDVRITVRDLDRLVDVIDQRRVGFGRNLPLQLRWEVPLDYPLGGDGESRFRVTVDAPKGIEEETFILRPAVAQARIFRQPGLNQPGDFERTESVEMVVRYLFTAAPDDCRDVDPQHRIFAVTPNRLGGGVLEVRIDKLRNVQRSTPGVVEPGPPAQGRFDAATATWVVNYTIPKDAEVVTRTVEPDSDEPTDAPQESEAGPRYRFNMLRQRTAFGNYIQAFNSSSYIVDPLETSPDVFFRPEEVERLESATLLLNITYADGSPITDADSRSAVEVEFREARPNGVVHVDEAVYVGNGLWTAEFPLDLEYGPLGQYEFHVRGFEDRWGNFVESLTTGTFPVVGARPVLETTYIVGGEEVDAVERTQTVSISMNAVYKNGVPLTPQNVDPGLGGILLTLNKRVGDGTVTGTQRLLMEPTSVPGTWVKEFHVPVDDSEAPAGVWDMEVIARDRRDPPNENVTTLPFEVRPARLSIAQIEPPPGAQHEDALVRGGTIDFRFRMLYPDRTPLTTAAVDTSRGARVDVAFERIVFIRAETEDTLPAVPERAGAVWAVQRNVTEGERLPEGLYALNVTGRDIYGNQVGPFVSRPFLVFYGAEFRNSTTELRSTYERGEQIFVVFPGAAGDTGVAGDPATKPHISLAKRSIVTGAYVQLTEDVGLTRGQAIALGIPDPGDGHVAVFNTTTSTGLGEYVFVLRGKNADGTTIVGLSDPFTIERTRVSRDVLTPFPSSIAKGEVSEAVLEWRPGDRVLSVSLDVGGRVVAAGSGIGRTDGNHITLRPPPTAPSGEGIVVVRGQDIYSNPWENTLGPVFIEAISIDYQPLGQPEPSVERGAVAEHSFALTYPNGQAIAPRVGEPSVFILNGAGDRVDNATLNFVNGRWLARWTPPPATPVGAYQFEVTGIDLSGNPIPSVRSGLFQVQPGQVFFDVVRGPGGVPRGSVATAVFRAPTPVTNVTWDVGTTSSTVGRPDVSVSGDTYTVSFATDRQTPLARLRFRATGEDVYGNELLAETGAFSVSAQQLVVQFTQNPARLPEAGDTVRARFTVLYPDGTRLGPQFGVPIPTIAVAEEIQGATAARYDPATGEWVITWTTPEEPSSGAYRFIVGGQDRYQNRISPASSGAFFVVQPLVPDYFPVPPAPPLLAVLASLAAALVVARRRRSP